ncbi:MAG: hypothetical protein KKA79_04560 [Nanoarchaeota archaeon]|nr:hypothetical protein [Nanoarchaeota archaeon]MCG2718960.1 hypothetical protein [Nanoarchaeota archaeon]
MQTQTLTQDMEDVAQATIVLKLEQDLEETLMKELLEKIQFQALEQKVVEDEDIKEIEQEEVEEKPGFSSYDCGEDNVYRQDKGMYHVEQPYEEGEPEYRG